MKRSWSAGWIMETHRTTFPVGETTHTISLCHGHRRTPFVTAIPENATNANYNVFASNVTTISVTLELSAPAPEDLVINVNACSTL